MLNHLKEKIEVYFPLIALMTITGIILSLILRLSSIELSYYPLYAVILIGGIPILIGQLANISTLNFSSDILAAISILTATLLNEYLAAALVILMLSGGETLERYASERASAAIKKFIKRLPLTVKKLNGEHLEEIEISKIKLDDIFSLDPHQISPLDGIVVNGKGSVDESLLTGEAFRVTKIKGSQIISGSVNGDSALLVKVTAIGKDTRYQKILSVMEEAKTKKLRLKRIGDRLGAYYTPFAILLALVFAYFQDSAITFLSVLVVATPCPLIIAIPVAIIGAISKAAEKGILIRDPSILENIGNVETVFLDKTGTMTFGEPSLTQIVEIDNFSKEELMPLVASLEQFSTHPLSKPFLKYATEHNFDLIIPDSCEERPGVGLVGVFNKKEIVITSRKKGLNLFNLINIPKKIDGLEVLVIVNKELALVCSFQDRIKPGGREFITHLRTNHGVGKIAILSGDTEEEVRALAKQVGIDEVSAKLSPEDKYEIVKKESLSKRTLFIGDGINDAPALSVATIGIAFGTGSEISTEAASAVIIDGKLEKLDELLHLGQRTRKIALQSSVGGMLLSIIAMGFAGLGYLNPVTGALTQEFIDVFAVLNALRTCLSTKNESDLKT